MSDMVTANDLPESVFNWLKRTQIAGLDIVAVATYRLPEVGTTGFMNTSALSADFFSQRPKSMDMETALANLFAQSNHLSAKNDTTANDDVDASPVHKYERTQIETGGSISEIEKIWQQHIAAIQQSQPIKLQRVEQFVLISCLVTQSEEGASCIGCLVAPPYKDNMLDLLQLSLGWLFFGFARQQLSGAEQAKRLMDVLSDITAQADSHSAAQEWVNLTKQWASQLGAEDLGVSLFKVTHHIPKWWVSANVSWAVKGSPMMQSALELASLAITECQPQQKGDFWAYPMHHRGNVSAVLVTKNNEAIPLADTVTHMLMANADFVEPILRQWQQSEQNLISHSYRSSTSFFEKLVGRGYLAYKAFAIFALIVLAVITLVPVDKVVNAPLYVEGDTRHTITTPQQGYINQVFVRPGDEVQQGQKLAKLEDKDLRLELAELTGQLEQTEGQFRQAMASMDASASGLAVNQREQLNSKIDLLNTKLDRTEVKSPIDGTVVSGDWQQKIGSPVDVGEELFQVADVSSYRIIIHVPDRDMDEMQVGQAGKMKLTSLPEQTFDFTVTRLTAVAEVKDGENGFTVEASLNESPGQINPGMEGVGKVIVGETNLISNWTKTLVDWLRLKLWSIW